MSLEYIHNCDYEIHRGCSEDLMIRIKRADNTDYVYKNGDKVYLAVTKDRTREGKVFQVELTWNQELQRFVGEFTPEQTSQLNGDGIYYMDAKLVTSSKVWPALEMKSLYVIPDAATIPNS